MSEKEWKGRGQVIIKIGSEEIVKEVELIYMNIEDFENKYYPEFRRLK